VADLDNVRNALMWVREAGGEVSLDTEVILLAVPENLQESFSVSLLRRSTRELREVLSEEAAWFEVNVPEAK
jgi:hypothetical protein